MKSGLAQDNPSSEHHDDHAGESRAAAERASILTEQASAVHRQLRQLLHDTGLRAEPELRLALADELLQELEVLGLGLQRPAVRQAVTRVRAVIGLPTMEASAVPMSMDTALAFLSLAIDPPGEMTTDPPDRLL